MLYRTFNKTGERVSLLGMGCMRLPLAEDGSVDRKTAIEMIRHSIDQGINYVDTAYMYHDGESEKIVGEALKDGGRMRRGSEGIFPEAPPDPAQAAEVETAHRSGINEHPLPPAFMRGDGRRPGGSPPMDRISALCSIS